MFEGIEFKHIVAYFLAVFNVMLATIGLDGFEVTDEMQSDVQNWIDILTGKE